MPEKEITKSQQTFITNNVLASSYTFSFYKVYKRKPQNRFRVRVVSLGDLEEDENNGYPNIYVTQGLVGTTGTLSLNSTTSNGMKSNEFSLGILGRNKYNTSATTQNGYIAPAPIEFYTDEVSTSPFKIISYNMYGQVSTHEWSMAVVFEITELEEY
jgi:hypothetical protein